MLVIVYLFGANHVGFFWGVFFIYFFIYFFFENTAENKKKKKEQQLKLREKKRSMLASLYLFVASTADLNNRENKK